MTTKQNNAASFNTSTGFNDERFLHQCECVQLRTEVAVLKNLVLKLEKDFKDSVDSNINREVFYREAVDFKFAKMEEGVKDTVATLEREVTECFMRRDKKWAKQLEQIKKPEFAISPPTTTTSPVLPTSTPGFPPANVPTASTPSQTINRATDGESCATTSVGPDFTAIFSHLPFSREELTSAQGDDDILQGLTISPSTPPTNGIYVQDHHGLLYRRIQKDKDNYKIQLIVPKSLVHKTIQHFHQRTQVQHHGRLKTLLRILDVTWWPTIRGDVWRFVRACKSCGVETKECVVIAPSKKPPHIHQPLHLSSSSSNKETPKPVRRKHQGGWPTSMAGCNVILGGAASPTQGHPGWFWTQPLSSVRLDASSRLVPVWEGLVLPYLLQRHFKSHIQEDTFHRDNGWQDLKGLVPFPRETKG